MIYSLERGVLKYEVVVLVRDKKRLHEKHSNAVT